MRDRPKHARPPTKADETPEFCEAWKAWQSCKSEYDGRASARDEFFRRVWWHGVDPADILDGARWYVHTFKSGQLRLKFDSWLERGMYEDDAEKWRAYQRRLAERQAQAENVVAIKQHVEPVDTAARARAVERVLRNAGMIESLKRAGFKTGE